MPARVEVLGVGDEDLAALRNRPATDPQWSDLFRISVAGASIDVPDVLGRYAVVDSAIAFTPLFPFDAGRTYRVVFDPARLPHPGSAAPVSTDVMLPAPVSEPTTVVGFHPSADEVPENLLRIYLEFSAPMGRAGGLEYVKLVELSGPDGQAERVEDGAFLPLEADFWSPDHTRYTLFFDPGRVKDDILPNRESGRPLRAGRRYAIDVAQSWTDANGRPLKERYRRTFRVVPALDQPIRLSDWKFELPAAGTRDALRIVFPHPLDHAILARALGVETARQQAIDGAVSLDAHDSAWAFTPAAVWKEGDYNLVAQSFLEDPQGNQINRAFEEQEENDVKNVDAPQAFRRLFSIGGDETR